MKRALPLFLLCLGVVGCITRHDEGTTATYTLAPWIALCFVILAVVMLPLGFFVVRRKDPVWPKLLGISLLTLFPLVSLGAAWAARSEYVKVGDDQVEYRSGALGKPRTIRYDECQRLEFRIKTVGSKRGQPNEVVTPWVVKKDGTEEDINPMLLRGEVLDDLVARFRKKGIPVSGDRRGL